ncbi:hypothetical protein L195_g054908 [Trifolium pratense]|uniref:Uncharacterized protein n=1 Tax=Trifolium pratense TaxID=57577 RepID=A0A2K3KIL6_TRIPR|nr:hypothetical protein L195_g054908 [Trifolium pratense]
MLLEVGSQESVVTSRILHILIHVIVSWLRTVCASPDMVLPASTKSRTIPKFYAPLVGATLLTLVALTVAVPTLDFQR